MPPRKKKQPPKDASGWRAVFEDFLTRFEIDSKETGRGVIKPYGTQTYLLDELASGMDQGIRFFDILKGRQFGVTTILIPVDVLWCLVQEGIKGAIIANSPEVAANCRTMVTDLWERLPDTHKVPITEDNSKLTRWENKSGLLYLVAGKTERNTSLGKSHGFALIHGTEVGEWGSEKGLNSLIASLAKDNPMRLYMFESTAEGKNLFYRLWTKSLNHPERKCIFVPWYMHERYALDKRSKVFQHYAIVPADEHEQQMIAEVRKRGVELTPQQIAWYRKTRDDMTSLDDVKQNYPSWPEEAFIGSAPSFFRVRALTSNRETAEQDEFKAFKITLGDHVTQTRIEPLSAPFGADLCVWEEPRPNGIYSVAIIPSEAAGAQLGGLSVVEVLRCFSDKVEQVAEYAACVEPYQLAWVGGYLAGKYRNSYVNMEMTGIGRTVFREFNHLREMINAGTLRPEDATDADQFLQTIVFYLYQRIDSASGASRTYHWLGKGDPEKTKEIYLDFKNSWAAGRAIVHSVPLVEEMGDVISDGDYFGPDGEATDDRVYTFCVALRTWLDSIRSMMLSDDRTREKELAKDQTAAPLTFLQNIVDGFFRQRGADLQEAMARPRR